MTRRLHDIARSKLRLPSAATLVALLALVIATVGTGIAASGGFSGKAIKKRSQPGNRLKKDTVTGKEVKESKLGQVPKAANALTLQGNQPTAFAASANVKRFALRLSAGQRQTLFSAGPLTFTARCAHNETDPFTNPNRDFIVIVISTSQDGAVFDGDDAKRGANPTNFLDVGTPENERNFMTPVNVPTGTPLYLANGSDGSARAPDGTAVSFNSESVGASVNLLGAACTLHGFAVIDNG
jgi:hypothetical protein